MCDSKHVHHIKREEEKAALSFVDACPEHTATGDFDAWGAHKLKDAGE